MNRSLALLLLVTLLSSCGGGDSSIPAEESARQGSIDILGNSYELPEGVSRDLVEELADSLQTMIEQQEAAREPSHSTHDGYLPVLYQGSAQERIYCPTKLNGDYNRDLRVDGEDLIQLARYFGWKETSHSQWELMSYVDGDGNGEVGISDLTPVGRNYFRAYQGIAFEYRSHDRQEWFEFARTKINTQESLYSIPVEDHEIVLLDGAAELRCYFYNAARRELPPATRASSVFSLPDGIKLTWDPLECDAIEIYRNEPHNLIATVDGSAREYFDASSTERSAHTYWLRARRGELLSSYSKPLRGSYSTEGKVIGGHFTNDLQMGGMLAGSQTSAVLVGDSLHVLCKTSLPDSADQGYLGNYLILSAQASEIGENTQWRSHSLYPNDLPRNLLPESISMRELGGRLVLFLPEGEILLQDETGDLDSWTTMPLPAGIHNSLSKFYWAGEHLVIFERQSGGTLHLHACRGLPESQADWSSFTIHDPESIEYAFIYARDADEFLQVFVYRRYISHPAAREFVELHLDLQTQTLHEQGVTQFGYERLGDLHNCIESGEKLVLCFQDEQDDPFTYIALEHPIGAEPFNIFEGPPLSGPALTFVGEMVYMQLRYPESDGQISSFNSMYAGDWLPFTISQATGFESYGYSKFINLGDQSIRAKVSDSRLSIQFLRFDEY